MKKDQVTTAKGRQYDQKAPAMLSRLPAQCLCLAKCARWLPGCSCTWLTVHVATAPAFLSASAVQICTYTCVCACNCLWMALLEVSKAT